MTSLTASPEIVSSILLSKIVYTTTTMAPVQNNNSTFTTTLTPLAPLLLDAIMTSSNKNKSATTPKVPTPPVQNQMTTKNFFTTRDKIHLDPQIKKEWQKTGKYFM